MVGMLGFHKVCDLASKLRKSRIQSIGLGAFGSSVWDLSVKAQEFS